LAGGLVYDPRVPKKGTMNLKLLLKAVLIIAVLAVLVMMGLNNTQNVTLSLPPILPKTKTLELAACYMYFGFFAVGFLVGTLLMAGGGKGGSKGASKAGKDK
jgi:uncharacterized membrane protein YciS (DUF1049 family)